MTICVIENTKDHHDLYVLSLRREFGDRSVVVPGPEQPCQTWSDARAIIENYEDSRELVLLLDLMLRDQGDIIEGLKQVEFLRQDYQKAKFIAITNGAEDVRRYEETARKKLFDGLIDKQHPDLKIPEKIQEALREKIAEVLSDVNADNGSPLRKLDSLGMRLAEAAITTDGLDRLVRKETVGWSHVSVRALTSGASGAHLLEFFGSKEGQPANLVIKMAVRKSIIEAEANALKESSAILGRFAGKLVSADGGIRELDSPKTYYVRQVKAPGNTLYDLASNARKSVVKKAYSSVVRLLLDQYRSSRGSTSSLGQGVQNAYGFRSDHPFRIKDSCARLCGAAVKIKKERQWSSGLPDPKVVFDAVDKVMESWEGLCEKIVVPYWAIQHGDLHGGNVFSEDGQLAFIDLARLRAWPVGYDVSRLATHARIHLPGQKGDEDWVINRVGEWAVEEFASPFRNGEKGICELANLVDSLYGEFIQESPEGDRDNLLRLYRFSSLSDLLRIISYTSLSHYKRIWVAIAIYQLAAKLGYVRSE